MDIDDLLAPSAEDVAETVKPAPKETAAQKRIRELEEAVAQAEAAPAEEEVLPELTADQIRIIELEAKLAQVTAEKAPAQYAATPTGETILIHFVEDGFTAQGQLWYRGQELEFEVGGEAHEQTKNRFGVSWLDMATDVDAQWERYGKEMFRAGPWRGKSWESAVTEDGNERDVAAAAAKERKRNRAAPLI